MNASRHIDDILIDSVVDGSSSGTQPDTHGLERVAAWLQDTTQTTAVAVCLTQGADRLTDIMSVCDQADKAFGGHVSTSEKDK